jgi:hypothetical protein
VSNKRESSNLFGVAASRMHRHAQGTRGPSTIIAPVLAKPPSRGDATGKVRLQGVEIPLSEPVVSHATHTHYTQDLAALSQSQTAQRAAMASNLATSRAKTKNVAQVKYVHLSDHETK